MANRGTGRVTILDELPSITINQLNKHINLQRTGLKRKDVNLYLQNRTTGDKSLIGAISVTVNIEEGNDYVILDYVLNGSSNRTRIDLKGIDSKIGKWYLYSFICPITGKTCRKIYLRGTTWASINALPNPHHKRQTESKKKRNRLRPVRIILKLSKAIKNAENKRSKVYSGKPTKKQVKAIQAKKRLNKAV